MEPLLVSPELLNELHRIETGELRDAARIREVLHEASTRIQELQKPTLELEFAYLRAGRSFLAGWELSLETKIL